MASIEQGGSEPRASTDRACPLCGERFGELDTCPHDGSVLIIDRERDPLLGKVIGQGYRLDAFIGAGGMGRVYRGVQLSLDRPVAVKVMRSDHSDDPHMIRRFLQEARLSSRLDHPNIVRVIDGGNTSDGRCYLVMELLEGVTLDVYVPEGGLPPAQAFELFAQLCAGVDAFHRVGLVHRDLKPNNVLLCEREGELQAKIFDFGLAKSLDPDTTGLTAEGEFLGTPGYLAPEQMSSGDISQQTDIYSLGAILHYMLSKSPAFAGASGPAIVMNQLSGQFAVDALPDEVSDPVRAIITRALEVAPDDRYASIEALIEALREARAHPPAPGPHRLLTGAQAVLPPDPPRGLSRRAWLMGGGAVLGAAGLGAFAWQRRPRETLALGMSGALTGPAGAVGQAMSLGLQARIAAANAARELPVRLELEVLDDGYEPARARANVERMSADKLALIGNVGTQATAECVETLLAAKLPLLGAHTGAEHLRRDPPDRYVFNFRAGYALETSALIEHFMREQYAPSSIAVFAQDDDFGASGIDGIRRALADQGFLEFEQLLVTRYPPNTMDVGAAVEAIAAREGLRAVIMVSAYRAAAQLVAGLRRRAPELVFAGISPVASAVFAQELQHLGHSPAGIILTQVVPDPSSSANGVLRYREALAAHDPSAEPNVISLEGFIVADLLIEALRRCERPFEREALVEALESFDRVDLGFGTPVSFSPSDHQGSRRVWATRFDDEGNNQSFELS